MKKLLIVDDDRQLAVALGVRCRALGLDVRAVHDAISALNAVLASPPDAIFLDVNLPLGNGLSVCEMLSSDERLGSIPVIVMTGNSDRETVRRCHRMCAYYVLKCPDVWQRLEPLLNELLSPEAVGGAARIEPQCVRSPDA
jgi:CheY-like chemotaxis protein